MTSISSTSLTPHDISQRAQGIALSLSADDFRNIIRCVVGTKIGKLTSRSLFKYALSMPGKDEQEGALETLRVPQVVFEHVGKFRRQAVESFLTGKNGFSFKMLSTSWILTFILSVIFLGMAIMGSLPPALVPLTLCVAYVLRRLSHTKLDASDDLLRSRWLPVVWRTIYAAALYRAVSDGEVHFESLDEEIVPGLPDAWNSTGLSWELVARSRARGSSSIGQAEAP